ncbi:hypothetical protein DL546_003929 [Coniochaeta pulveracea]|uniref:Uncharacterized protein n=1 Tax=Coniochaeta pulveracea TaxID=177199 RepID=A0A420Y3S2_9PEZI|nr:hypothetical protein DL546_003929 [Coniochaeta pulveracea]
MPRLAMPSDFKRPRLRKCGFDLNTVDWRRAKVLGAGLDGFVWRVRFGNEGPYYALKLFWDQDPLEIARGSFAAQRECQNAALLQMIRYSLDQAAAEGGTKPVLVIPDPANFDEAEANFFGFAEEVRRGRKREHFPSRGPDLIEVVEMPRFAKCYGWLRVNRHDVFPRMPRSVLPHAIRVDKHTRALPSERNEFLAVVYEYVEDGENDIETVEEVARFLWLAGFSFCPTPLARNWRSGVLVDHSDITGPQFYGWQKFYYRCLKADILLQE